MFRDFFNSLSHKPTSGRFGEYRLASEENCLYEAYVRLALSENMRQRCMRSHDNLVREIGEDSLIPESICNDKPSLTLVEFQSTPYTRYILFASS